MKKFPAYLAITLLLFVAACKKNEQKTAPAVIHSINQSPSGNTTVFAYDGEGRLTSQTKNDGSKTLIVYSGDTIIETDYNTAGALEGSKLLTTDSFGLATGYALLDSAGQVSGFGTYAYDGNKHKVHEWLYDDAMNLIREKNWGYDAAGDISAYEITDPTIPENNEQYYYGKYYITQTNTTDYLNQGQAYYGTGSHNLIKSMERFNYLLGNIMYYYAYTFDEYGRTVTVTATDHNGKLKYTNTYTYN